MRAIYHQFDGIILETRLIDGDRWSIDLEKTEVGWAINKPSIGLVLDAAAPLFIHECTEKMALTAIQRRNSYISD